MNHDPCEPSNVDMLLLLKAMTLRELRAIDASSIEKVLCHLDELKEMVARGHRAEMAKIDQETNELAAQIDELESAPPDLLPRLQTIAARLKGIAAPTVPNS